MTIDCQEHRELLRMYRDKKNNLLQLRAAVSAALLLRVCRVAALCLLLRCDNPSTSIVA